MNTEITAVVVASEPAALVRLCGISMLERVVRQLQRLGFSFVIVLNATPEARAELESVSWARSKIHLQFADKIEERPGRFLIVPGDSYCDPRIFSALLDCSVQTVAIDTNPPAERRPLLRTASRMGNAFFCGVRLADSVLFNSNDFATLDVGALPFYIGSVRRTIHPLWFPAPTLENVSLAENLILDVATKGTPDIPSIFQAPVETWVTRHLCRMRITPNQVTFLTSVLGLIITVEFYRGQFTSGLLMAVAFGILDGVDGKLARVKVETTELGKWEHYVDHALEYSWWLALAWSLNALGLLRHGWWFGLLVIAGDLLGKIVTRPVKAHTGKPSHDFSPFEQRLRLIGGRRDIYIAMLLIGLAAGRPALAFACVGCWSVITALIQTVRSIYICWFTPRLV